MRRTSFPSLPLRLPVLFLAMLASSHSAYADDDQLHRLRAEATALYARVLELRKNKPERCMIASKWLEYAVPESIAREHLGLQLHGDVTPPYHATVPSEIIGPNGALKNTLCDDQQENAYAKELIETSKQPQTDASPDGADRTPRRFHIEYSFPVFDDDYTHAVIIAEYKSLVWLTVKRPGAPDENATSSFWSMDGEIDAEIYAKENGAWGFAGRETLATFQ